MTSVRQLGYLGFEVSEADRVVVPDPETMLAVNEALERLAEQDAETAELAKLRLFAGLSVEEARRQLSWRHLHLRGAATGVLHLMLDRYAADSAAEPMSFREWIERRYDPAAIMAEHKRGRIADFVANRVLARE